MCVSAIDLSGNNIGREGVECLVEMLSENVGISELVSNNEITTVIVAVYTSFLCKEVSHEKRCICFLPLMRRIYNTTRIRKYCVNG